MKNPAGANELLRTSSRDTAPSDRPPDRAQRRPGRTAVTSPGSGMPTSRRFRTGSATSSAAAAGPRSWRCGSSTRDGPSRGSPSTPGSPSALDRGIAEAGDRLIVLPTYSALLELQSEFALRGLARPFWSSAAGQPRAIRRSVSRSSAFPSWIDSIDVAAAEDRDDVAGPGATDRIRERLLAVGITSSSAPSGLARARDQCPRAAQRRVAAKAARR